MESDLGNCRNFVDKLNVCENENIQCEDLNVNKVEAETAKPLCKIDHSSRLKKFEQLKKRSQNIREASKLRQLKTEKYRANKKAKKALKDSTRETGGSESDEKCGEKWDDIKPFLTVNDHLHGPIAHGDCGPKTELECIIDDAIEDGDFERAEILSDSLANRKFAVKISNAFAAKRYSEKKAEEDALLKARNIKKIRWGFEVKERWQMKGNM